MPVYTVFHRSHLPVEAREFLASGLTELHHSVTGASRQAVRVMFIYLDQDSLFMGGQRVSNYVRVTAQIRQGRSMEQKSRILRETYEIVQQSLQLAQITGDVQIQTQITEIDDQNTVMTNGVFNA